MDLLLKCALVGTGKFPAPPLEASDPFDRLLIDAACEPIERRMLLQAGIQGVSQMAGVVTHAIHPLEPAPEETKRTPTSKMTMLLQQGLSPDTINLLPEFVRTLGQHNFHLPHTLLPTVLDFIEPQRRRMFLPLLGERARWLAGFNPEWRWVDGSDQAIEERVLHWTEQWNEGTSPERLDALRNMRLERPALSREWLQESLSKEKADQRRKMLELISIELSANDLPLLEKQLNDRSESVKDIVRELLLRLPESAFSLRMFERARTVLKANRGLNGTLKFEVDFPDEPPQDWVQDGIVIPQSHIGRLDRFAEQLIATVPPEKWCRHFDCDPRDILSAIRGMPAEPLLLSAFRTALQRQNILSPSAAEFVSALWDHFVAGLKQPIRLGPEHSEEANALLRLTPTSDLENRLTRLIRARTDVLEMPFAEKLSLLPRPWSVEFSQVYLTLTRTLFQRGSETHVMRWSDTLLPAALGLHPGQIDGALSSWTINSDNMGHVMRTRLERHLRNFGDVLKARASFHQEIRECDQKQP